VTHAETIDLERVEFEFQLTRYLELVNGLELAGGFSIPVRAAMPEHACSVCLQLAYLEIRKRGH